MQYKKSSTFQNRRLFQTVFIFFCAVFLAGTAPAEAQTDTTAPAPLLDSVQTTTHNMDTLYRLNGRYLKSIWLDFRDVVTRPAHWQGKDFRNLALVAGTGTLLLVFADREVRTWTINNQREALQSGTKIVEPFGNRLPPVLITGMYLTGLITGNRQLEHSSLSIARAVMISTGLYTATKSLIRRQRPVRTDNPYLFAAPFTQTGYTSFPSGHANTVFAVATAFALEYKEHKWVPWVVYPIATLTALARVYENRHWTSDVLVGASFGHFITRAVYKAEEKRKQQRVYKEEW